MKRLFSLIVACVMLVTMLNIPVVSANTSATPVFTLDISDYTNDNQVVKNGVTGSSENITIINKIRNLSDERSGPAVEYDIAADGTQFKYLSFADDSMTAETAYDEYLGAVKLDSSLVDSLLNDSEEMTVEFWAKPYTPAQNYGRAFAYGNDKNGNNVDMSWQTQSTSTKQVKIIPFGYKKSADTTTMTEQAVQDYDSNKNEWHYYAISRKWTTTDEETGAGKWEYVVVIDGNIKAETTLEDVFKNTITTYWDLTIGGKKHPSLGIYEPFDGGIAEFNIYNKKLSSAEMIANYNADQAKYKNILLDVTNTLNCTNANSAETISIASGSYELTFDNYVNADTLENGITLTNSQGGVVATAKALKETPVSKTVVITYPNLTAGTYTLSINSSLKSINGIAATPKTITFTASESRNYLFNEEFTNAANDSAGLADESTLTNSITLNPFNASDVKFTIETSETTGDKWITATTSGTSARDVRIQSGLGKKALAESGADYFKRNFAVEIAYKDNGTASSGNRKVAFLSTSAQLSNRVLANLGTYKELSAMNFEGVGKTVTVKADSQTMSGDTDADGFDVVRFTFTRTADGKYDVAARNLNDNTSDGVGIYKAETTLDQFTGMLIEGYEKANSASSWSLSKLVGYEVSNFSVISHGFSADKSTYDIVMSDNLNENYAAGITLAIGEDTANATVSGNKISIPAANLPSGAQTISLAGILNANDVYCYDSISYNKDGVVFMDADDNIINGFNEGTGIVKAEITTSADAYEAFMVVYDGNGNIQMIEPGTEIILDELSIESDWVIKCIVLDSFTSLVPLFNTSEITLNYCL